MIFHRGNVALEIHDESDENSMNETMDWDDITENVYSTLKIESDEEDDPEEIGPDDIFDDDPPLQTRRR